MAKQRITVEIDGSHTFELESKSDPETEARAVFERTSVVEKRDDESFTVHPVGRVTAVYVGEVPARTIGFPTVPRR